MALANPNCLVEIEVTVAKPSVNELGRNRRNWVSTWDSQATAQRFLRLSNRTHWLLADSHPRKNPKLVNALPLRYSSVSEYPGPRLKLLRS